MTTVADEIADLLVQSADVLRVVSVPASGTGVTRRDYVPFASGVPCRIYLSMSGGRSLQSEAGLRVTSSPHGMFLLDAPVLVQDRLVVDGVTYLVTFARLVHDDVGPSHVSVDLDRVAIEPMLSPGVV